MVIYLITAYRWGDCENHSYVVGAFDTYEQALKRSREEEQHRGGKYECEIAEITLNSFGKDYKIVKKLRDRLTTPEDLMRRLEMLKKKKRISKNVKVKDNNFQRK